MDFAFSKEQEDLRKEVHDFLVRELPVDFDGEVFALSEELEAFYKKAQKKMVDKGWLAASWPQEHGGLGLSEIEQGIINEEQGYWATCWYWPNEIGITIAAPVILIFGTEEQKKKLLPPIARGEAMWDLLFTEPNAGSDLANVQLRASADGDDFILNGQKYFVGSSYKPDWLITLTRTADATPKHKGLTMFVIPADTPGITYRPFPVFGGELKNEAFFDDVRVSKENILGELNRGFYVAVTALDYDRTNSGMAARFRRNLDEFVQFCKETKRNGKLLIEDPQVRDTLAQVAIEVEILKLAGWRTVCRFDQRDKLGPLDYDLAAYYWKLWWARHCDLLMNIMGLYGQLRTGSKWSQLRGSLERRWQLTRSPHNGGTLELVKLNLARSLGLPRKR